MEMEKSWIFFKGEGRDVLEDLRRYIESHLRGYVYNILEQQIPDEKLLLQKLIEFTSPYQLIVSNVGLLISDLLKLVNDAVTRKYVEYINIIDKVLEGRYDFAVWPIAGFLAVMEDVYNVTVYVVVADFDSNMIRLVELREAELRPVDPDDP